LSGYTQITTLLTAINSGDIYRYITKPWETKEELIPAVRDGLNLYISNQKKVEAGKELEQSVRIMKKKVLKVMINKMQGSGTELVSKETVTNITDYNLHYNKSLSVMMSGLKNILEETVNSRLRNYSSTLILTKL